MRLIVTGMEDWSKLNTSVILQKRKKRAETSIYLDIGVTFTMGTVVCGVAVKLITLKTTY